jgi:hypothetical protein
MACSNIKIISLQQDKKGYFLLLQAVSSPYGALSPHSPFLLPDICGETFFNLKTNLPG